MEPLGTLRLAATDGSALPAAGSRLAGLELPVVEPLRWLAAPPEQASAEAAGAEPSGDESVYVEFEGAPPNLAPGVSYAFSVRARAAAQAILKASLTPPPACCRG